MRKVQSGLPKRNQDVYPTLEQIREGSAAYVRHCPGRVRPCARHVPGPLVGTRLKAFWPHADAKTQFACWENTMKAIANFVSKLVKDEQGGEVLEYALIAGLIVVAAIAVIGAVGGKVLARWTSLNAGM
jgi:pilus assembly protein Flp/PilA